MKSVGPALHFQSLGVIFTNSNEQNMYFSDRTVTDGELFVEIFYNGKELYKNHFPLCTAEDSKYTCFVINHVIKYLGRRLNERFSRAIAKR